MSYLCGEIKAYDAKRQVITVAFSEQRPVRPTNAIFADLSLAECHAVCETDSCEAGLTEDERSVVKLLLDSAGKINDALSDPERLIGRVSEIGE